VRILYLFVRLLHCVLLIHMLLVNRPNELFLGCLLVWILEIRRLIVGLCDALSFGRLIANRDIVG
jgi:hypothetical protein